MIHVGLPSREQYVHRAGRTGRLAATGRSILMLSELEKELMKELKGLELHERAFEEEEEGLAECLDVKWWHDAKLSASAHLFYASAISFYLKDARLKASAQQVVENVSELLRSTGLPKAETSRT